LQTDQLVLYPVLIHRRSSE